MKLPRSNYADRLREVAGDVVASLEEAAGRRGRWGPFFRGRIGDDFDGRIVVEVGCFDAEFLGRVARRHPRTAFVGIDWKARAVYDGGRRLAEASARNVVLMRGRGQDVGRVFGEREVEEVWVFHPDPFEGGPAERAKRLIGEAFLADVHGILRNGSSTVTLKTDHAEYYERASALLGLASSAGASEVVRRLYAVGAASADFWNDPAALAHAAGRPFAGERTLFESRFVKRRRPIYYLELVKR